jgi:hypothetical protein
LPAGAALELGGHSFAAGGEGLVLGGHSLAPGGHSIFDPRWSQRWLPVVTYWLSVVSQSFGRRRKLLWPSVVTDLTPGGHRVVPRWSQLALGGHTLASVVTALTPGVHRFDARLSQIGPRLPQLGYERSQLLLRVVTALTLAVTACLALGRHCFDSQWSQL